MGPSQVGTPAGVGAGAGVAEQAWAETRADGKTLRLLHPHSVSPMGPPTGQHGRKALVRRAWGPWLPTQTMAAPALRASKEVGPEHRYSSRRGHCECQHS